MAKEFEIDKNNRLVAYHGKATVVKVPEGVVEIGRRAFYEMYDIKEIILPKSCTVIGDSAFFHCRELKTLTINGPVTSFGDDATWGCESLENFTIPETTTTIGRRAISIAVLKKLHIPKSVFEMKERALDAWGGVQNFEEITVDEDSPLFSSVDGVLYNKDKTELILCPRQKKVEHLIIPDTVQVIKNGAFEWHKELLSVSFPSGLRIIEQYAFRDCENLADIGKLPQGLKKIGFLSFYGCKGIKELTVHSCIEELDDRAFENCSGLEKVTIEDGIKKVDFLSCIPNIKEVYIPASVTEITAIKCREKIDVHKDNKNYSSEDGVLYNKDKTELIAYAGLPDKEEFFVPDTVEVIKEGAFYNNKTLKRVILPEGLTHIEKSAFSCYGLVTVELPSTLEFIGEQAFVICKALKSLDIPNGTEFGFDDRYGDLRGDHFRDCGKLERITLPQNLEHIYGFMFNSCSSLKEIVLPPSLKTIECYGFYDCKSLTEIVIPPSCEKIDKSSFSGCKGLTKVVIPPTVTSIYYDGSYGNSFYGCENLTIHGEKGSYAEKYAEKAKIPFKPILSGEEKVIDSCRVQDGVLLEYVGTDTDIVIPKEAKSISAFAFAKVKPKRVTIHNEVEAIAPTAFGNNTGFIIVGDKGYSYAGEFAREHRIPFLTVKEASRRDAGVPEFEIENGALKSYNGDSLNITIPDEVHEIKPDSFIQYDIESLTLGKNVKYVNCFALPNNAKISNIYYDGTYEDAKKAEGLLDFFKDHGVNIYMRNEKGKYEKTLGKDTKMFTTRGMDVSLIFDRLSVGEKTLEARLKEHKKNNKGKFKTRFSFENGKQGFIFECSYKKFDKDILNKLVQNRISMVFDDMVISFPPYIYVLANHAWGDSYGDYSNIQRQRVENGALSTRKDAGDEQQVDKIPASTKKIEPSYFDTVRSWRAQYTGKVEKWLEIEGHEDIAKYIDNGIVLCYGAVVQYLNIEHGKLPEGGGYWGSCHLGFKNRLMFEEASQKGKYWETIYYLQASAVESNYMRHEASYFGENGNDDIDRSIFDYDVFCDTCVDLEAG